MEELVNVVSQKTGLSHDQAQAAAQAVLDYLMTKLPAPVAGQIKSALGGGQNLGDMAKGLGGMFGQKKS
jgi:hypothetical protein